MSEPVAAPSPPPFASWDTYYVPNYGNPHFLCVLCKGLLMFPLVCLGGGHGHCHECFMGADFQAGNYTCRVSGCTAKIPTVKGAFVEDRLVENIMSSIPVRCPYCEWSGQWGRNGGELVGHVGINCRLRPKKCGWDGCTTTLPYNNIEAHQASCTWRRDTCALCNEGNLLVSQMGTHLSTTCPEAEVVCPQSVAAHASPSSSSSSDPTPCRPLKRNQLDAHLKQECPWTLDHCSLCAKAWDTKWTQAQEPATYFRKDRLDHLRQKRSYHSLFLADTGGICKSTHTPKPDVEVQPLKKAKSTETAPEEVKVAADSCTQCIATQRPPHLEFTAKGFHDLFSTTDVAVATWSLFTLSPTSNHLVSCMVGEDNMAHLLWWIFNPLTQQYRRQTRVNFDQIVTGLPLTTHGYAQMCFVQGHLVLQSKPQGRLIPVVLVWSEEPVEPFLVEHARESFRIHMKALSLDYEMTREAWHVRSCGCLYYVHLFSGRRSWYVKRYRLPFVSRVCAECMDGLEVTHPCDSGSKFIFLEDKCSHQLLVRCVERAGRVNVLSWNPQRPIDWQFAINMPEMATRPSGGHASHFFEPAERQVDLANADVFMLECTYWQPHTSILQPKHLTFIYRLDDEVEYDPLGNALIVTTKHVLWSPVHHVYVTIASNSSRTCAIVSR